MSQIRDGVFFSRFKVRACRRLGFAQPADLSTKLGMSFRPAPGTLERLIVKDPNHPKP